MVSVADADMRDKELSWANQSPYADKCDQEYLRDYGVSVDPYYARIIRVMRHETVDKMKSVLDHQVGNSNHYKDTEIQPIEFISRNNLSFTVGNVIKYLVRAHMKGGAEDIKKAIHYCQIELELKYKVKSEIKYEP